MSPRRGGVGVGVLVAVLAAGGLWAVAHVSPSDVATGSSTVAPVATSTSSIPAGSITNALQAAGLVSSPAGSPKRVDVAAVSALLSQVPSDTGAVSPGYSRAAYGPAWADTDHNGCDQRDDVLSRDLTTTTYKPSTHDCVVLTGILDDEYTGKVISFTRGVRTSSAVQIDHLVPLGWAWNHGASGWTETKREQLATDLNNLQAVDGPTNEAKSDAGPGSWLPPATAYRCIYVTRFTYITQKYGLSIDTTDRAGITRALSSCTGN